MSVSGEDLETPTRAPWNRQTRLEIAEKNISVAAELVDAVLDLTDKPHYHL